MRVCSCLGFCSAALVASVAFLGCGTSNGIKSNDAGVGATNTSGSTLSGGSGTANGGAPNGTGGVSAASGGAPIGTGGVSVGNGGAPNGTGGVSAANGGAPVGTGGVSVGNGGAPNGTGGASVGNGGAATDTGGSSEQAGATAIDAALRHEAPYPAIDATTAGCGNWAFEDNVCCAQYCSNDNTSESCDKCGGPGAALCTPVNTKACISGEWPEVHSVTDNEDWHYSRSTHFGLTNGGACAFGYYGLCTTKFSFTDPTLAAKCDAFCTAYPDLCADPTTVSLRGNFAAPQGNYYTQFWPSLPGDRDNYLSCGECFELIRTKQDGTEYQAGETGYTDPIVLQVVDSCPCSANSKWCCGSGRDHCGEVISGSFDFKYGCPLPPGNLPADHDPESDESIHLDLSDIAMARLQNGDPNKGIVDGVIPTKYKRVPCPVVGNLYIWLRSGASNYYFALSVVNAGGPGSVTVVEAQLADGTWSTLHRDANYTSARPQERYGTWVVPQGAGPFALPMSLRITSPSGQVIEATAAIKSWAPTNSSQDPEMYYIDLGVQF